MRAVWLRSFGPPSVLEAGEAPEPTGEVVIDVAFANITFVETQVRAGHGPFPVSLPMIPGNGVGGTAGGRRVIASLGGSGGYAERAAVPAAALFDVPEGMALDDAVALLADGRTATLLVEAAALQPGETALILAAAGGVGTLLVQLAARAGCTVIAAASSEHKLQLARELGAHTAVDYTNLKGTVPFTFANTPDAALSSTSGAPAQPKGDSPLNVPFRFDVVFDGVGGEVARAAFEGLRAGGRMLSFGLASGSWADVSAEEAAARGVTLVKAGAPRREHTERALASGLKPVIGQRFGLEQAAAAHAAIEARATVGKTLLVI